MWLDHPAHGFSDTAQDIRYHVVEPTCADGTQRAESSDNRARSAARFRHVQQSPVLDEHRIHEAARGRPEAADRHRHERPVRPALRNDVQAMLSQNPFTSAPYVGFGDRYVVVERHDQSQCPRAGGITLHGLPGIQHHLRARGQPAGWLRRWIGLEVRVREECVDRSAHRLRQGVGRGSRRCDAVEPCPVHASFDEPLRRHAGNLQQGVVLERDGVHDVILNGDAVERHHEGGLHRLPRNPPCGSDTGAPQLAGDGRFDRCFRHEWPELIAHEQLDVERGLPSERFPAIGDRRRFCAGLTLCLCRCARHCDHRGAEHDGEAGACPSAGNEEPA